MRRLALIALLLTIGVAAPGAQSALTAQQREADLMQLASEFAKNYGPYEWARDVIGFDLYRMTPWLQRIRHSDDLDFQEAVAEYVAAFSDVHVTVDFPSPFLAQLGFTLDIFDGKPLITTIDRSRLPLAQFPFGVGDELVALDGESAQSLIASLGKYGWLGNARSRDRFAASLITVRPQEIFPRASQVGDAAIASIRFASTGAVTSYTIPWVKTGLAIDSQGPVPSPRRGNGAISGKSDPQTADASATNEGATVSRRRGDPGPANDALPHYMDAMQPLLTAYAPEPATGVSGLGARNPIYARPAGFVQRLGTVSSNFFFSGTYVANGVRIGLLRIPNFAPASATTTLRELDTEIAFLNANTDVLVVDTMRNTGGNLLVGEMFAQRLIPKPFQTIGFEVRATAVYVSFFASTLASAIAGGAPPDVILNLKNNLNEVLTAYNEERGRTVPLPFNALGSMQLPPAAVAYTKPILLLVDEFTVSTADMFAAIMQDNQRAPLFGIRTAGGGGGNRLFDCTTYTEALCSMTISLMNRGKVISTPGFPPSPYIENVGVQPDIIADYMTRANLITAGAPFVQAFTDAAVKLVKP